jgi:hypothetical protein
VSGRRRKAENRKADHNACWELADRRPFFPLHPNTAKHKRKHKMQKTSTAFTFLASSLLVMAALAMVATLFHPGGNVSKVK